MIPNALHSGSFYSFQFHTFRRYRWTSGSHSPCTVFLMNSACPFFPDKDRLLSDTHSVPDAAIRDHVPCWKETPFAEGQSGLHSETFLSEHGHILFLFQ